MPPPPTHVNQLPDAPGQLPPTPQNAVHVASYVTSGPWDSDLETLAMKCVFVTVGTTSFDDLIASVLAPDCLQVSGGGGRVGSPLADVATLGNLAQQPR